MRTIQILGLISAAPVLLAQNSGDAARGQAIFEGKGGCTSCHRIKGTGSRTGPDLSEIGARSPEQLRTSLLDPDAEMLPGNRYYRVVLKDGSTVTGRLINQDTFTVQLIDSKENLRSFVKSDLKEGAFVEKSPMPSFKGRLSDTEISDVVAYLSSLKPPPGRGGGGRGAGAPPAAPGRGPTP